MGKHSGPPDTADQDGHRETPPKNLTPPPASTPKPKK